MEYFEAIYGAHDNAAYEAASAANAENVISQLAGCTHLIMLHGRVA